MKTFGRITFATLLAVIMLACSVFVAQTAVTNISGLSVVQNSALTGNSNVWNNVIDGAIGTDNVTKGILSTALYASDGASADYVKSNGLGAIRVDGRVLGEAIEVYSVALANLTTAVAMDFGFDASYTNFSGTIQLSTPTANTQNVCVNFQTSATVLSNATCPAANTATVLGIVMAPGETITLYNYAASGISAVAASGTQSLRVKAWNH